MVRVSGVPYEVDLPMEKQMNFVHNYSFSYSYDDGTEAIDGYPIKKSVLTSITINDTEAWDVPLAEFVDFLSQVYGYDISEKITITSLFPSNKFKSESPSPKLTEMLDDDEEAV